MVALEAETTVHNGWKAFSRDLEPWTDDVMFWAFRKSDRKTFLIRYDLGRVRPKWQRVSGSSLAADEVDYVLPLSAFTPPLPDEPVFRNPLPVVVMLVRTNKGLVAIRRALKDGYGKVAFPGGYHNQGETWQEAGCRELVEETGLVLDPLQVKLYDVVTVQNGAVNLIFGVYDGIVVDPVFVHDCEIMEVLELEGPVETAFPAHTEMMARYFAAIGGIGAGDIVVER